MTARQTRHVAVLGAGIQGCCIALELARRGHRVDLYDRCALPLTQTSYWNEGKVHLGLVYANDPMQKTYLRMLDGALRFESLLERWFQGPVPGRSTPFYYAVPQDSLLSPQKIERHFDAVAVHYNALRAALQTDYFGSGDEPLYVPLDRETRNSVFGVDAVRSAYRTIERSVNPRAIAAGLRAAIDAEPKISFRGGTEITGVSEDGAETLRIAGRAEDVTFQAVYGDVVNALWAGRLAIDATFGLRYERTWLYRHKLGIVFKSRADLVAVPSTTFVLGSYGDTVCYDDGTIYLSWYPECLVGSSGAIVPPDQWGRIEVGNRQRIVERSFAAMAELVPALQPYRGEALANVTVGGGTIFAWGSAGIDDPGSELHRRYDIGILTRGRYHSVDTGKYTMAPYFATETCDRIEGSR